MSKSILFLQSSNLFASADFGRSGVERSECFLCFARVLAWMEFDLFFFFPGVAEGEMEGMEVVESESFLFCPGG